MKMEHTHKMILRLGHELEEHAKDCFEDDGLRFDVDIKALKHLAETINEMVEACEVVSKIYKQYEN